MEVIGRIQKILERAEAEIREIGADAFRIGDDAAATRARDVVNVLKSISVHPNGRLMNPTPAQPPVSNRESRQSKPTRRRSGTAAKRNYPRYTVRNGSLIRIGWSKKQKAEYEHKVPQEAFDRTVKAMSQLAQSGQGPFTAETIIEYTNDSNGSVPSYQVYVVIGLLRDHGFVEQVGRDGYIISEDVASCASHIWNQPAETNA